MESHFPSLCSHIFEKVKIYSAAAAVVDDYRGNASQSQNDDDMISRYAFLASTVRTLILYKYTVYMYPIPLTRVKKSKSGQTKYLLEEGFLLCKQDYKIHRVFQ